MLNQSWLGLRQGFVHLAKGSLRFCRDRKNAPLDRVSTWAEIADLQGFGLASPTAWKRSLIGLTRAKW